MDITLTRVAVGDATALGLLWVEGDAVCFGLECRGRRPAGRYPIRVRTRGPLHARYAERFAWHRGVLELVDAPGDVSCVLLSIGDPGDDARGCVLTGLLATLERPWVLYRRTDGYARLYRRVIEAALAGDLVLEIQDPTEPRR